jgi:hypothetical protein
METWKAIPGYKGLYEVSDLGQVRSSDRMSKSKGGSYRLQKGRIIKGGINSRGYRICLLYPPEGKRVTAYVHRLVLSVFICDPDIKYETCHNDGDKLNNRLGNLRWDTHVSNCEDRERHGTNHKGEKNGNAKLTEKEIIDIRADTRTQKEIASSFKVSRALISMIRNKKYWKHI